MAECTTNIPDYIVLPAEGSSVPGPPGPPGPQGPPGIGELPVPADDVSVTNQGFNTAQEIFDFLLYVPIDITSLNATKITYEIGESISALGFTWGLNKTGITSQILTGAHVESGNELGITARSFTATFSPNLAVTSTFTLAVDDDTTVATRNRTINFFNGVYFGNSPLPISVNSDFILSLSKTLQSGRGKTFVSNAGADVFVWYAHKTTLGLASFNAGGFAGGFEDPTILSFTNASGHTEDYNVYRSTNPQIGAVTIIVT